MLFADSHDASVSGHWLLLRHLGSSIRETYQEFQKFSTSILLHGQRSRSSPAFLGQVVACTCLCLLGGGRPQQGFLRLWRPEGFQKGVSEGPPWQGWLWAARQAQTSVVGSVQGTKQSLLSSSIETLLASFIPWGRTLDAFDFWGYRKSALPLL